MEKAGKERKIKTKEGRILRSIHGCTLKGRFNLFNKKKGDTKG
jgi:hypothetical protein